MEVSRQHNYGGPSPMRGECWDEGEKIVILIQGIDPKRD